MTSDRRRDRQDPDYIGGDPGFWTEPPALNESTFDEPPLAPPVEPPPPARRPAAKASGEGPFGVVGWAKAIALGARDTWEDMLSEGREGARESYQRRWRQFESKTKYRNKDRGRGA